MKKEKQKEKECPLCEISSETLEKLKQENKEISLNKPSKKKRKFWRKILVLIIVLALGGFAFYSFFSNFSSPKPAKEEGEVGFVDDSKVVKIGSLAPGFTSEDISGNKISLSDFQNKKPVLLVFWATWCGYCAKEFPDLKIFTAKHKNEIQIIAIASGESRDTIRNYIQEKDVNFLMLLDEKREIWNQYSVRGTPSHFLINRRGEIVTLRPGLALINDLETIFTMLE